MTAPLEAHKTYHGKPCRVCAGTERYKDRNDCAACSRARSNARAAKPKTFIGGSCPVCHGNERYISGGKCVYCTRSRAQKRWVPVAERPARVVPAPVPKVNNAYRLFASVPGKDALELAPFDEGSRYKSMTEARRELPLLRAEFPGVTFTVVAPAEVTP